MPLRERGHYIILGYALVSAGARAWRRIIISRPAEKSQVHSPITQFFHKILKDQFSTSFQQFNNAVFNNVEKVFNKFSTINPGTKNLYLPSSEA